MNLKRLCAAVGAVAFSAVAFTAHANVSAPPAGYVCDPANHANCIKPDADGSHPIAGADGSTKASASNPLPVTQAAGSTTAVTQATAANLNAQVVGTIADNTADSGNSIKIGCRFTNSPATITSGNRAPCWADSFGAIQVGLSAGNVGSFASSVNGSINDGLTNLVQTYRFIVSPQVFNGSTWDKQFTCANTASVNVTAGNTTQIVALSGSTVIRVCSVALSMSAAGTVQFVYGTGANCGTGQTAIMGAMSLATGTPWAQSAPEGGSLMRSASGNALCVAAATGNVVGFVTYAQF